MNKELVNAEDVKEGDFLPGLCGGGYVYQDPEPATDTFDVHSGFTPIGGIIDNHIVIFFHDQNGDENYLITLPDNTVEVGRQ